MDMEGKNIEESALDTKTKPAQSRRRSVSPSAFRKNCDICKSPNDVLVRCQIDKTNVWHFVCTKRCWKQVSGGVIDGSVDHPYYKYGGMWKNKHALVSAKKPKRAKKGASRREGQGSTASQEPEDRSQQFHERDAQ